MTKFKTYIKADVDVGDVRISHYSGTLAQARVRVNVRLDPGINVERELVTWGGLIEYGEAVETCKADLARQLASYGVEMFDDHPVEITDVEKRLTLTTWKELGQ